MYKILKFIPQKRDVFRKTDFYFRGFKTFSCLMYLFVMASVVWPSCCLAAFLSPVIR